MGLGNSASPLALLLTGVGRRTELSIVMKNRLLPSLHGMGGDVYSLCTPDWMGVFCTRGAIDSLAPRTTQGNIMFPNTGMDPIPAGHTARPCPLSGPPPPDTTSPRAPRTATCRRIPSFDANTQATKRPHHLTTPRSRPQIPQAGESPHRPHGPPPCHPAAFPTPDRPGLPLQQPWSLRRTHPDHPADGSQRHRCSRTRGPTQMRRDRLSASTGGQRSLAAYQIGSSRPSPFHSRHLSIAPPLRPTTHTALHCIALIPVDAAAFSQHTTAPPAPPNR